MCTYQHSNDPLSIKQYHPSLQLMWKQQITAYIDGKHRKTCSFTQPKTMRWVSEEKFIDWDDPYRDIRFWKIIDFLRNAQLTK